MATNLDKFKMIEEMMRQAEGKMEDYLAKLRQRYDYMNELRKEYSNLSHTLGRIQQALEKQTEAFEEDEDVKVVQDSAIEQLEAYIESLEEDNAYNEHDVAIKQLKGVKDSLEGKLDEDSLGKAWRILKVRKIEIEEINVLMDLIDAYEDSNRSDVKEQLIKRLMSVRNEYVSSFVTFRTACDESDDIEQDIQRLADELEDAGYDKESDMLAEAKPDTAEERGKRPDPEPLLSLLNPIKSAGLEYFQSNNRRSDSYELNVAFAKEVAYTRRALLEDREYIGTRNAFERVTTAFEELSEYMYARFHQLGGTPNNYHGHEDRH